MSHLSRTFRLLLFAVAATVVFAAPAAADPATPTNFISEVTGTDPALPLGVEVLVIGGDAFLELTVPEGHTAEVPDYGDGEITYLRYLADGTVERNDRSAAAMVNTSRYGSNAGPFDPDAEPSWSVVSNNGRYAWHDHRIHWMSKVTPATGPDGLVDLGGPDGSWEVPLIIDGSDTTVTGQLRLVDGPSPWLWFLLTGLVAVTVVAGWAWKSRAQLTDGLHAAVVAYVASAGAVTAAAAEWRFSPPDSGASPVYPAMAVAAAVVALAMIALGNRPSLMPLKAAAASLLVAWGLLRIGVWSNTMLPTSLSFTLDRALTSVAVGVGLGMAVTLVLPKPKPAHGNGPRPSNDQTIERLSGEQEARTAK